MSLFTKEERQQVARAVTEAEATTAGELVVVETPRSASYGAWRAGVAAVLSVAMAHELSLLWPEWPHLLLLGLQLPLGALWYFFLGRGVLLRLIVPSAVRTAAVERRALGAFVEAGVTETRDRSGVLIFLSDAEHRAVILADKGINDRVERDEWQKDVDDLVLSLRRRQAAQGLSQAITRIGALLAEKFPQRHDDTNELSDEIRRLE